MGFAFNARVNRKESNKLSISKITPPTNDICFNLTEGNFGRFDLSSEVASNDQCCWPPDQEYNQKDDANS